MLDGKFIGFYMNPDFELPGKTSLTDPTKLNADYFKEYTLKPGSVLIDAGLNLKDLGLDPGPHDLLKNSVPHGRGFDIGAIEKIQK
jgi:hypothetical protein